jgi:hypothetical protein
VVVKCEDYTLNFNSPITQNQCSSESAEAAIILMKPQPLPGHRESILSSAMICHFMGILVIDRYDSKIG